MVSPVAGLVLAGLALALVLSSVGGVDEVGSALRRVDPLWAAAALVAESVAYLLLGTHLRRLTRRTVGLPSATGLSLIWFGLGNALPGAPAPGLALAAAELRRRGMTKSDATTVMGLSAWFNIRTLLLVAASGGLVALAFAHAPGSALAWVGLAAIIVAVLLPSAWLAGRPGTARAASAFLRRAAGRRWGARFTPESAVAWHGRVKAIVGPPRSRVVLVMLGVGAWLADAACLALALRSVGVSIAVDLVLLAYLAGIAVSALPLLPGGLGLVEATVPAVLHRFGAPLDLALAGTLVYRLYALILPAAGGALVLLGARLLRGSGRGGNLHEGPETGHRGSP